MEKLLLFLFFKRDGGKRVERFHIEQGGLIAVYAERLDGGVLRAEIGALAADRLHQRIQHVAFGRIYVQIIGDFRKARQGGEKLIRVGNGKFQGRKGTLQIILLNGQRIFYEITV